MKRNLHEFVRRFHRIWSLGLVVIIPALPVHAQRTDLVLNYQGELRSGGAPVNGMHDFQFKLFDAPSGGTQLGATASTSTAVSNGIFNAPVQIDWGALGIDGLCPPDIFPCCPPPIDVACLPSFQESWLEIWVKTPQEPGYTLLSPRQQLNPAPTSMLAADAGRAYGLYLPYIESVATTTPALSLTQTGDGPAALFKVQPQPEPPSPSPAVEAISATSAPAVKATNTGAGPAATFFGNVGIGIAAPSQTLEVDGNIGCTTVAWAGGISALGDDQGGAIELGNSLATGNQPYIDFHRGVGMAQDYNVRLQNDADRRLSVAGDLRVTGTLAVEQPLTVSGDLAVEQELTVGGDVTVGTGITLAGSGNVTLSTGDLTVGGDLALSSGNLTVSGDLAVDSSSPTATISASNSGVGLAGSFTGAVHVTGNLTRAYTSGTSNSAAPIAYATVDGATGLVIAGTPNVSSAWESGNQRFVITIAGESYSSTSHVTTVTPIVTGSPEALFATTSSSTPAGTLRIRIMSSSTSTTGLQKSFQFIVYKP